MQPLDPFALDPDLLVRYLAGQTTPPEAEAVRCWIAARPENAVALAALEQAVGMRGPVRDAVPEPSDGNAVMDRIAASLAASLPPRPERPPLVLHREPAVAAREWRSWAVAATVLLAVGGGIALWRVTVARAPVAATTRVASDYREYATRPGERADFRLTDGTHVLLGVASTLRVPRDYGRGPREVALDGEAYFDVTHDAAHPFRVQAANAVATDLGTRFNVRAYAGDAHVEVVVVAGRVALSASSRSTPSLPAAPVRELAAGDLGIIDTAGLAGVRHGVDTTRYLGWVQGRLVFDGARLGDVIPELARWYDLDIRLTDNALANRRLTVTLRDESVSAVLDRLALLLDLKVERNGQVVIVSPATARGTP